MFPFSKKGRKVGIRIFSENGPPDLDELFRRFLQQFKGKKTQDRFAAFSGADDKDPRVPKINGMSVVVALLTSFLLLLMLGSFYTVDESERAVLFRFGKPVDVKSPGLHWHIPLVESFQRVNVSNVRTVEIGYRNNQKSKIEREALMLTDNLNIIDLQFAVQYTLKDPEAYLFENRSPEAAVLQVAETAMREIVGTSDIDFVLYGGREEIASEAQILIQEILDHYETGIIVKQVAIQNVQPPDQVQNAFEDAIKARQDRERKINEGEAYANDILPRARGQAARIKEEAEGYRLSVVARAEGEISRFSQVAEEYSLAPTVTRRRLYLDTLESVMSRTRKIVVDQDGNSNNILYIPLDRLIASQNRTPARESDISVENGNQSSRTFLTLDEIKRQLQQDVRSEFESR